MHPKTIVSTSNADSIFFSSSADSTSSDAQKFRAGQEACIWHTDARQNKARQKASAGQDNAGQKNYVGQSGAGQGRAESKCRDSEDLVIDSLL